MGVPESTMSIEGRQEYIDLLIVFTNKPFEYWEKRTDREIIEEYQRLIRLD